MKTKNLITNAIFGIAVSGMIFTGCKKGNADTTPASEDYTSDAKIMYDQSVSDASFDDAGNVAD